MISAEQEQVLGFGTACYQNVITIIIDLTVYGCALLGMLIAIWLLNVHTWREPKAIQLLCCMIILSTFTGFIVFQGIGTEIEVISGIVEEILSPPRTIIIAGESRPAYNSELEPQLMVGDFVIGWRAWVLLPHDKMWRLALAAVMICNIGLNLADSIFDIFVIDTEISGVFVVLDWLSIAFSLLVNMLATTLIGWKAWAHYRTMGDTSTWRNSRVTKLLLLFIESGALFLVIQLFALVGELGNMLDTTGAFILVAEVASAFLNIFSVLYPIGIVILIHSDKSPVVETFHYTTQVQVADDT
ncbi:hypothetical protein BDP27DRAFT_1420128 [Rhodocollybia butyracea]|uniref:Uncharacterized protein n=1 Tax=Rhodocollybia butyracea TaxID=206335 RepID=A0A9P5U8Q4_9AGAR|nr:hypothetical protein BDP27DRAFT_1420128 [Rhodocollybia butyracea]